MADASHELRTPVSIIRSAAEVTLSRDQRSESEYRETITTARDQSLRLGRLVEDMLVLARADAGGYPIHPIDLDLDEIVDECRRAVKMLASERGVHVQSSAGPEVPIRGDADLLRRLLLNLLQNAIQHTSSGGSVIVTTEPAPDIVRVRVSDGGPGIPEADRTRIFDRFVRLDESAHRQRHRSRPAHREMDCRGAWRHARAGNERTSWQHVLSRRCAGRAD